MAESDSLDALWSTTRAAVRMFDGAAGYPEPVRRYLTHAIAPGMAVANAVRLRMHGEIKLGRWRRFEAEQVIASARGMTWTARTTLFGLPVSGYDRYLDGAGEMRWKIFGSIPFMSAAGPDVTRSAAGRFAAESMWLPSSIVDEHVRWSVASASEIVAEMIRFGRSVPVTLAIGPEGAVERSWISRWGNPNKEPFAERPFGAIVEEERTFNGYTIPSRVRVGWYFGTDRFERDGEFFRCTLDTAHFR